MAEGTGSTGILSFLATSPKVSTLCSAGGWACEGTWILTDRNIIPQDADQYDPEIPNDWNSALHAYSRFWNASQPVLIDKSPPNVFKAWHIYSDLKKEGKKVKFILVTRSPCYGGAPYGPHMDYMVRAKRSIPSKFLLHIRFEDLIINPFNEAVRVLKFLPELSSLDPSRYGLERSFENRSLSLTEYIFGHGRFHNAREGKPVLEEWMEYMNEFRHDMMTE